MKHTLKEWVAVTRYWSFTVSAMPVVVTFAYLCSQHLVDYSVRSFVVFFLAVLGVVVLHAAGNVLSDWADYRKGVDNEKAYAVPNLVYHLFEPRQYLVYSIALFVVGIAIGMVLVCLSGTTLLWIGGLGVLLTLLYSFLKYHALGDLDIFIIFSILPILGTSYVVTGHLCYEALVLAIPVGLITVSVLHANNTVDSVSDAEAGIKTFAMLIGGRVSAALYIAYMIIPFVAVVVSVVCGWLHWLSLLSLVALMPAYRNIAAASHYGEKGIETLSGLDQASAKMQLLFSGSLSLALFVAAAL